MVDVNVGTGLHALNSYYLNFDCLSFSIFFSIFFNYSSEFSSILEFFNNLSFNEIKDFKEIKLHNDKEHNLFHLLSDILLLLIAQFSIS